ncbi:hypothetical protein [Kutzneria sp. CA-103260]|uniref:hypothetical protein n=1 Tax=Kutzneria sp. CA-103260 TaxID=2802641 RepID=UPI001BACAD63|nr:hypothetical protein [Kutzneria sp. CA-103260]QUQ71953.1 hypothetical protein JJ691_97400 [Kutzneria sp. CA-103260]
MTEPTSGRLAGSPQPAGRRPYLRRLLGVGLAGAGLVAFAACGSVATTNTAASAPAGSSSPTATTTTTPSPTTTSGAIPPSAPTSTPPPPDSPPVQATGPTVPPSQVNYSAAPENVPQTVWQQDGGKTLVVMAEQGGCVKVNAQVTKQTADEVDITVLSVAEMHRVCPLYVRNIPIAAHLDAPLGGRLVVLTTQTGTQH